MTMRLFLLMSFLGATGCHLVFPYEAGNTSDSVISIDTGVHDSSTFDMLTDVRRDLLATDGRATPDASVIVKLGHGWAVKLGGLNFDKGFGVALDSIGNVYVTGIFSGTADFGNKSCTSKGDWDIFVASFAPDGVTRWLACVGGTGNDYASSIAVDPSGNVTIAGYCNDTVLFAGQIISCGNHSVFIASFDSGGGQRWSRSYGSVGPNTTYGLTTDSKGNIYITGYFFSSIDFGDGPWDSNGLSDTYLAVLDVDGDTQWSRVFGGDEQDSGHDVAVDRDGNVYLTGEFRATVMMAAESGFTLTSKGEYDMFLASFSPIGAHRWSKGFGSVKFDGGRSLTIDSADRLFVSGYYQGPVDMGDGELPHHGSSDILVASFSSDGTLRWSKGMGGDNGDYGLGVTVDDLGQLYVTGYFSGDVDFGGGVLRSQGQSDIFLSSYDSDGYHQWSTGYGGASNDDQGHGVAVDSDGSVYLLGSFAGSLNIGGLTSNNDSFDAFLLKLDRQ